MPTPPVTSAAAGLRLATLAMGLLVAGGCGGTDAPPRHANASPQPTPVRTVTSGARTVVLDASASGSAITLTPGQRLRIELTECSDCGFGWRRRRGADPRVLRTLPKRTHNPCRAPCVGGIGTAIYRYRALAPGATTIDLLYLRFGREPQEHV